MQNNELDIKADVVEIFLQKFTGKTKQKIK